MLKIKQKPVIDISIYWLFYIVIHRSIFCLFTNTMYYVDIIVM